MSRRMAEGNARTIAICTAHNVLLADMYCFGREMQVLFLRSVDVGKT
jgi:hypothetical protein